jgi:hypothetical protein
MRKSLSLRKETLSELTLDELGGIVGASGSVCVSGGDSCLCSQVVIVTYACLPETAICTE